MQLANDSSGKSIAAMVSCPRPLQEMDGRCEASTSPIVGTLRRQPTFKPSWNYKVKKWSTAEPELFYLGSDRAALLPHLYEVEEKRTTCWFGAAQVYLFMEDQDAATMSTASWTCAGLAPGCPTALVICMSRARHN